MKTRMKKQREALLPVKLLVAPLTALMGKSKAIKMTWRQIVCDTSKRLEKAEKLRSTTSSSALRQGKGEKKHKVDKHAPHGQQEHPGTPALGLPPDPNTDSSPATARPMITLFPLSCSEGLINALICK